MIYDFKWLIADDKWWFMLIDGLSRFIVIIDDAWLSTVDGL